VCPAAYVVLSPAGFRAAGYRLKVHTLMVAFECRLQHEVAPPLTLQPTEVDVAVWLHAEQVEALLAGTLRGELHAAPVATCEPPPHVAAAQLVGVYPNELQPAEGLGLAHHFILSRWLAQRAGDL
jgi:hypothetical protein